MTLYRQSEYINILMQVTDNMYNIIIMAISVFK